MSEELWKDIIGYEGLYQVSDMGKVRSLPRKGSPRLNILRGGIDSSGYPIVGLVKNKGEKPNTTKVHRLVAIHFILNPLNLPEVNHKFGIKTDNRSSQLEWCTHQTNIAHAFEVGLKSQVGSKCPRAILNDEKVLNIRKIFSSSTLTQKQLSIIYGVSVSAIKGITSKRNWSHL